MNRWFCLAIVIFSFACAAPGYAGEPGITDVGTLWETDDPYGIAANVDISGNGQHIVAGWYLNNKRTAKYNSIGAGTPVWEHSENAGYYIPVSTSDNGNVIASCGSQVPLNVWLNGAGPNPSWSYTAPDSYNWIDVDVSDNGAYVAAVCKWNYDNPAAKLFVFNSGSSTPVWQASFTANNGVNGVEISEDNGWIVASCYHNFFVYNNTNHALFFTGTNDGPSLCGIDDNAEYLAAGDLSGILHLYRRIGSAYVQQWQNSMGGQVTAVDVSSDASTVIAGASFQMPSYAGMVRGFGLDGSVRFTYSQYGDKISGVALCNNGSVGVAGSWGQFNGTFGDVFTAFNMANGNVLYHLLDDIDEPGSIYSVAISDNGAYATCGGKAVHARGIGYGGEVYSIDLTQSSLNVEVTLTPVDPPIVIPANGGSFQFEAAVIDIGPNQTPFNIWARIKNPDGSYTAPTLGPVVINPPLFQSISRLRTQNVPAQWTPGIYTYLGYANTTLAYPAIDSSGFEFAKLLDDDGGPWIWDASCTGEPFPGEQTQTAFMPSGLDLGISPNPFNPSTAISYKLQATSQVKLTVWDIAGRLVETLVDGQQQAGQHQVTFDGSRLAAGMYFLRLHAGGYTSVQKLVLMK